MTSVSGFHTGKKKAHRRSSVPIVCAVHVLRQSRAEHFEKAMLIQSGCAMSIERERLSGSLMFP